MNQTLTLRRNAQLVVVLLCALILKLHYSAASANQLRWILAPTTALVELVSGRTFEFESHAGYMASDRSFLIAASCAGVNFLITAFLMLSLRKLWKDRSQNVGWKFVPLAALFAYLATLVANTVRISIALWLHGLPPKIFGLSSNQLHRFEGIFIYFGFLLLLFIVNERMSSEKPSGLPRHAGYASGHVGLLRKSIFPLLIYYATTLGVPLASRAFHHGITATDFWEHSLYVMLIPLLVIPLLIVPLLLIVRTRLSRQ